MKKTALVTGATGVVGRNLVKYLLALPDWDVVCVSRRKPDLSGNYRHIAIDLLDRADCDAKLTALADVTHVFSAAYVERPIWAELSRPIWRCSQTRSNRLSERRRNYNMFTSYTAQNGTATISAHSKPRRRNRTRVFRHRFFITISTTGSRSNSAASRGPGAPAAPTRSAVSPSVTR